VANMYLPMYAKVSTNIMDETGMPFGVKHVDNKIRTSCMPYLYDIAVGNISGHEPVRRFGYNPDVDINWETICGLSTLQPYLTSAERLQVASNDAADDGDPPGTGTHTVLVSGLDENYDRISETVVLNGTTNVMTDASFLRVLCLAVTAAGSTGSNEGTITVSNNADDTVLAQIEIGENNALCASYTVPNGYTLYIVQIMAAEGSNKGSQFAFWKRSHGGLWTIARRNVLLDDSIVLTMPMPVVVTAKTDVEMRVRGILAGATVAGGFEGWIEAT